MGHRELTPVHVPLRTSSRAPVRTDPLEEKKATTAADRRISKAQRFFGTDISLPKEHGGWQEDPNVQRPSFVKPPGSAPRQSTGFVPFPNPSDNLIPEQNLRVRASSPLLGQNYRSQEAAPPLPKPSKKIHHTGSSSTLFSYFSSRESSKSAKNQNQSLQPRVRHGLSIDPQVTYTQASDMPKESKRKMRPSRIDLSGLFPKPKNPPPQTLLSPHRMVNSPSPVSTVVAESAPHNSDGTTSTTQKTTSRRPVDIPPRRSSAVPKKEPYKHGIDNSDLPSIAESKSSDWPDHPLERTVGTSEIDLALDRYAGRRSLMSRSSTYSNSREHLQQEQHRHQESRKTSRRARSPNSRPKDNYLSPSTGPDSGRARGKSTSQESWKSDISNSKSVKSSLTKKSSKSTLKNRDLRNTSILCLSSSSEDEDDEEHTPTTATKNGDKFRGSVDNYGDYEGEVYTASTAHATTATAVRRFDRAPSTSSRGSHLTEKSQPVPATRPRKVSQTSNGKSSTRRSMQTNRSSGVPTIPDEILAAFPQQPCRTPAELKELNRRSRVIAVTRQEQDLLEAMRLRKGKQRLPPFDARSEKSVPPALPSPGFSVDYSESLPSPSTNGASPLTPTLPIHRFSPLPSPKPPPQGPPPAIPEDQKLHTRRRSDSSEAIMLHAAGDMKQNHGLPLWSFDFDWNQERANIATVH
ncbi:hypothetical protein N7535_007006 [Penicillium sp. DV-2018c]|nr:hypothetical protein N7535_007006 [Penicillium sp. DV-2018c]